MWSEEMETVKFEIEIPDTLLPFMGHEFKAQQTAEELDSDIQALRSLRE